MTKRRRAILLLLITSAIWGLAGPVIKVTLAYIPPFTLLFFRFLVASFLIFPFFVREQKKHPLHFADLPRLTVLSFFGQTLTLSLVFLGLARTTALQGVLLASIVPVFIIIAGAVFLKETINDRERIGLAIIILGSLITAVEPLLNFKNHRSMNMLGNLLIISSGLSWTVFSIKSKALFKKYSPFAITAYSFYVGLASFIPLALWENSRLPSSAFRLLSSVPGILYLALFSSVIAYYTYELGLKSIEASEAAIFSYLQPVFTAPLSVIFLKETLSPPFIIGAGIIALGVIISNRGSVLQRKHLRRHKI